MTSLHGSQCRSFWSRCYSKETGAELTWPAMRAKCPPGGRVGPFFKTQALMLREEGIAAH